MLREDTDAGIGGYVWGPQITPRSNDLLGGIPRQHYVRGRGYDSLQ